MIVVVDASVALKWFFRDRSDEDNIDRALDILTAVRDERVFMIQPPHFMAEVAAVLAREKPQSAVDDLAALQQIDWRERADFADYQRAVELAARFGHHLFDTLYHGVALGMPEATLVTSDRRYYRLARSSGQVTLLRDFVYP